MPIEQAATGGVLQYRPWPQALVAPRGDTTVRETSPAPIDAAAPEGRCRASRSPRASWLVAVIAVIAVIAVVVIVVIAAAVIGGGVGAPASPPVAMDPPRFVEEAAAAGIDHVYGGEPTFFVGGGVAAFDCDDDGRPDLYLAGGAEPAALYRNRSPAGGALRFERAPDIAADLTSVTGAYPIDIDGDRVIDLAVLRVGENVLLRGLGDCRFERSNEAWGFSGGAEWTVAFSATWEGANVLPTLAVGNYAELDATGEMTGACSDSELVRPDAGTGRYGPAIALSPGWCTLSVLFSDWDRAGQRDLRMTNDRHYYRDGEEQLWRVVAGEPPRPYTRDDGWPSLKIWGMGIASQDLTGDGRPEVFLTSQADNKLQTLVEGATGPDYRDIALRRGVTAHRPFAGDLTMPSTAWHPEFADVNNDGFMDLFISKGNVGAMLDFAAKDPSNLLIGQADGTFTEGAEAAGIVSFARGRGAALADFNLDGMLDLVEVNRNENVKLWRNVGFGDAAQSAPMGHWLALQLDQEGPDPAGVGSWVEVRVGDRMVQREVTIGGGHAGGQLGWIHAGLGYADRADVRVQWPDGTIGPWITVEANRFAIIERGASEARPWTPPQDAP